MIEVLKGYPDSVLVVEGIGTITADDYSKVLVPEADRRIAAHEKIRLLCHLGERYKGLTAGAAWADTRLGIDHWNGFERIAIVTDAAWIRDSIRLFAPLFRYPMKVFPNAEFAAARHWLLEPVPAD